MVSKLFVGSDRILIDIQKIILFSEVNSSLVNFVTTTHIEWISSALLIPHIHKDLVISLARLVHMFSEKAEPDANNNSSHMNSLLLDLFVNKNFLVNVLNHLSISLSSDGQVTNSALNNLSAKLYLIGNKLVVTYITNGIRL
jgi:hypothetical protein